MVAVAVGAADCRLASPKKWPKQTRRPRGAKRGAVITQLNDVASAVQIRELAALSRPPREDIGAAEW